MKDGNNSTKRKKSDFMSGYQTYDTSSGFGNGREWRNSFYDKIGTEEAARIMESETDTPCQILGVREDATLAEIKSAFRNLLHEWHPDHNTHRLEEAELMSKKIIAAYTILNPKK